MNRTMKTVAASIASLLLALALIVWARSISMDTMIAMADAFFYWAVPSLGFGMMMVAALLWWRCEKLEQMLAGERQANEDLMLDNERLKRVRERRAVQKEVSSWELRRRINALKAGLEEQVAERPAAESSNAA